MKTLPTDEEILAGFDNFPHLDGCYALSTEYNGNCDCGAYSMENIKKFILSEFHTRDTFVKETMEGMFLEVGKPYRTGAHFVGVDDYNKALSDLKARLFPST